MLVFSRMKTIASTPLLPFAARSVLIVAAALIPLTGCTYLPVRGPDVESPPPVFDQLTHGDLGAAHGYVIGIAPTRLSGQRSSLLAEREQALLASLDSETVPVRADPNAPPSKVTALGPSADQRARAQEAVEAGVAADPTGGGQIDLSTPSPETNVKKPLPTTAAATAPTADLNNDGFITLDEVIALHRAKLSPQEIVNRINATRFVLAATPSQIDHLRRFGVPEEALAPFNPEPPRNTQGRRSSVAFWDW